MITHKLADQESTAPRNYSVWNGREVWSTLYWVHWHGCLFFFFIKQVVSVHLIQDGTEALTSACVNQEIKSKTWKYVKKID